MPERKADTTEVLPEQVQQRAETVFESREIALKWLDHPIKALGGEIPNTLLRTPEGRRRVYQLLAKIEAGEFS